MTSLFQAVDNIIYEGVGTHTSTALDSALNDYVINGKGRRSFLPHITIFFTDGITHDDVTEASARLKKQSKVMGIAVGNKFRAEKITQIASEPFTKYGKVLDDYEGLVDLQRFVDDVTTSI